MCDAILDQNIRISHLFSKHLAYYSLHIRAHDQIWLIIIVNLVDYKLLLFNVERWIPISERARAVQKKKIFSITSYIHAV